MDRVVSCLDTARYVDGFGSNCWSVGRFVGVILGESRSFEVRPSVCWDVFPRLPVIPPVGGTGGLNGMDFFGGPSI